MISGAIVQRKHGSGFQSNEPETISSSEARLLISRFLFLLDLTMLEPGLKQRFV